MRSITVYVTVAVITIPCCTPCLRTSLNDTSRSRLNDVDWISIIDEDNDVLDPRKDAWPEHNPSVTEQLRPKSDLRPSLQFWMKRGQQYHSQEMTDGRETRTVTVTMDTKQPIRTVDTKFLSIALDSSVIKDRWKTFDFKSERLHTLSKALSPCYLRLGGTEADFVIFNETVALDNMAPKNFTNFTMTVSDWDNINRFARDVGWNLIFGLNVLLRHNNNTWDASNAIELLNYTIKQNYSVDWELGNEPNSFSRTVGKPLDASVLAKDFISLRGILNSREELRHSLLIGPDTTKPKGNRGQLEVPAEKYIDEFLKSAHNVTNATTWHQYYVNGRTATLDNFTDYRILDLLIGQIQDVQEVVDRYIPGSDIWLGETSSAYGGGAPSLSNTYAAGFMWLDKLGIAASHGLQLVIRQTLYHGHYALIDDDLNPYPDYWLSVLYKRLVGPTVLSVQTTSGHVLSLDMTSSNTSVDNKVRVYAHCTNSAAYPTGSITMYAMSLHKKHNTEIILGDELSKLAVDEYLLTPHDEKDLTSRVVNLNGVELKMNQNSTLPDLTPRHILPPDTISLPPRTFGFYVIPGAMATACP